MCTFSFSAFLVFYFNFKGSCPTALKPVHSSSYTASTRLVHPSDGQANTKILKPKNVLFKIFKAPAYKIQFGPTVCEGGGRKIKG